MRADNNDSKRRMLDRFEPGGDLGAIEDRSQYEERLQSLVGEQRELAEESVRLADLCQYFSEQRIDIPPEMLERIGGIAKLEMPARIRALRDVNQALMEYLNRVDSRPQLRQ